MWQVFSPAAMRPEPLVRRGANPAFDLGIDLGGHRNHRGVVILGGKEGSLEIFGLMITSRSILTWNLAARKQ